MAERGQEQPFHPQRLSDREAPIPAVRGTGMEHWGRPRYGLLRRRFAYLRINQTRRCRSAACATSCGCCPPEPSTSIVYAGETATGSRVARVVTIVIPDGV